MDFLLVAQGSAGDILPFIGAGRALTTRGYQVAVATTANFEYLVRGADLPFLPIAKAPIADLEFATPGSPGAFLERGMHRVLAKGLKLFARKWRKLARGSAVLPWIQPVYEVIARNFVPGRTVVAATTLALGARIAHDRLGVPLATVHLSPYVLRSVERPTVVPPMQLPDWLPVWARHVAYGALDTLVIDPVLAGPINSFRARLDLPPVRRLFADWRHAPERTIGMFPDWFAPPQSDWPAQVRLTSFPLFDAVSSAELPADLQSFLDAGDPPLVFTPGTAVRNHRHFFAESAKAAQQLGRRALLMTRFPDQLPKKLPDSIRHFAYVPFSQVLPRAAALIYHAGIGSAAQALAAGIPQLVVPAKIDQPDNAQRLEKLGVAHYLRLKDYRANAVADALRKLLDSPEVAARCREAACRMAQADPFEETCRLLEEMIPTRLAVAAA